MNAIASTCTHDPIAIVGLECEPMCLCRALPMKGRGVEIWPVYPTRADVEAALAREAPPMGRHELFDRGETGVRCSTCQRARTDARVRACDGLVKCDECLELWGP